MPATSRAGSAGKDAAGFTLVELLVVLAIMALIAALATPTLDGRFGSGVRADAEALGNALRRGRAEALATNREVGLTLDVERRTLADDQGRTLVELDDARLSLVTARRELIDRTSGRIRFWPDGRSTGARIRIDRDGASAVVVVDWLDGSVEID